MSVDGTIHGFLSWATSLFVASILGFAAAGGILHMAGSAVGATADVGQNIVEGLGLNTQLTDQPENQQIMDALRKATLKMFQPEFLQAQLDNSGHGLTTAVKNLAVKPGNSDAILDGLNSKLKSRAESISKGVDRMRLKKP